MRLFWAALIAALALAAGLVTGSAIPCDDPDCLDPEKYQGTAHFACCAGMTLRAYCLLKLSQHAQFIDGACDQFITKAPTYPAPTKLPTRYIFPTQSPQSKADYDSYFTRSPTEAPTDENGVPHPATSGGGSSAAVGFGVALAFIGIGFGGVFLYRRRKRRQNGFQEPEFGVGSQTHMNAIPRHDKDYRSDNYNATLT